MKIARISYEQSVAYAAFEDDGYRLISGDIFGQWQLTTQVITGEHARLLAPVEPPQVVCIGLNYREHAIESGKPIPSAPVVFIKSINTIIGPEQAVRLPQMAPTSVDYEAELVVVIGKTARKISSSEVDAYVLGYTCGNDISARDCQLHLDQQWARGKSFDTFAPLGPWIATDVDPDNLEISLQLNGEDMQRSNTADMIFSCRQIVSYLSHCMTLYAGSVIYTGTPSGVGFARTPPRFLRPGDNMCVSISGIGCLHNQVCVDI